MECVQYDFIIPKYVSLPLVTLAYNFQLFVCKLFSQYLLCWGVYCALSLLVSIAVLSIFHMMSRAVSVFYERKFSLVQF